VLLPVGVSNVVSVSHACPVDTVSVSLATSGITELLLTQDLPQHTHRIAPE